MNNKQKYFFKSLIIIILFQSHAKSDVVSGFTRPKINIELTAFSVKEDALLSRGAGTQLETTFNYIIEDGLKLNFWPVASFISGQQSSRDPQNPLTNSIYLKEASIEKDLNDYIKFKAGSLYQKDFLPGVAGQAKSFPSVGLISQAKIQNHWIQILGEAAVPTSSGLATSINELNSNSTLFAGSIMLKSEWTKKISTLFNVSHFDFSSLSSQMAADSIQRGNTVVRISSNNNYFAYKYSGNEFQFDFNSVLSDEIGLSLKTDLIINDSAPSNLKTGYYLAIVPSYKLNSKYTLKPKIEHYHVESDAMVAVFSDTTYGRTNRDGYRYAINLENDKYNLELIFSHSKLIQSNPFQSSDTATFFIFTLKNVNL